METVFIIGAISLILGGVIHVLLPSEKEATRSLEQTKAEFEKKDANLKAICTNMAEFDKVIKERDAAILAGDKDLYEAKVREASAIYKKGNELF